MGTEMKLKQALLGCALAAPFNSTDEFPVGQASDFGIKYVDCEEYFVDGEKWPLSTGVKAKAGRVVKLCQNVYTKPHYYATLYSVDDRIPVYSAAKVKRNPNSSSYPRPNSTWTHFAMGLCLEKGYNLPDRSFYSNFASVSSSNWGFCSIHQADDADYKGNTSDLKIDRGHVVPNGIMNQDEDAAKATFTLTNVAPQHSNFNQQAWNQLECMVRQYMEREIPNKYAYVITGTYDTKLVMNESNNNKNDVRLPKFYWKAFCYTQSGTTYSWAYIQLNDNNEKLSSGDLFMTVKEFMNTYYDGERLFNNACNNAGFGPWNVVIDAWNNYRSRWGC